MNTYYCPICFKNKKSYLIISCNHFFCRPCIRKWTRSSQYETRCPLCRKHYIFKNLKPYTPTNKKINKAITSNYRLRSKTLNSRIKHLIDQLKNIQNQESFKNKEIEDIHSTFNLVYENISLLKKNDDNTKNIIFEAMDKINYDEYKEINIWKWKFREYFN